MGEGTHIRNFGRTKLQLVGSLSAFDVFQSPTGQACIYDFPRDTRGNVVAGSANDYIEPATAGTYTIPKTANIVLLKGVRVYWDHSANSATYRKVADRDFYCGRAAQDAASSDTVVHVELNIDPPYDLDLFRDPCDIITTGTQALGGFLPPAWRGGALHFVLSATNEAQILSLCTVDGFAEEANAIIEAAFRVVSDGAGTVVDVSIGAANAAHATDMDSATESLLCHLDANNTNINFESDDGTVEVAATDSTTDYTEGATTAVREVIWFDMRDPADVQIYRNAVLMLTATVFDVDAATGPWKLICHVEKTASTDTYELALDTLRAWYSEQ